MVVKGKSRANPAQLARHLLRTDQNECVEIIQCDSSPTGNLREAFKDLQLLAEQGTRGTKGLYHAQINPDARYEMSPEQWARAADILEEELGLSGQPRTVVFHQKKGRPHIHVVWGRTDLTSMTLVADSHNYLAHERASERMEIEFGHDRTPGVHHKRDREKKRPRAAFNHASWQQFERTKLDPRNLSAALTDLYKTSDSGQAFRGALKEQGYALAQGRRGALILVDPTGNPHKLGRRIEGHRAADIKAKFADLDLSQLPTVEEAQERLKARAPEPGQPIPLPHPGPAFNRAARPPAHDPAPSKSTAPPDPEAARRQLRAQLEADKKRFEDQLRRDSMRQEAHWAAVRREEMDRFDARREEDRKAQAATREKTALWHKVLDALPGGDQRARKRAGKHRLRDEWHDQQERAQRSRELAAWEQQQRVTFRRQQAEQREAYEARYAAEIARLDREEARYAALRRDAEDRAPEHAISRSDTTPEPLAADLGSNPSSDPATDTDPPPHLQAAIAADHEALIAHQQRQRESAEHRWQTEAAREVERFETRLEARREAERQEEARKSRGRFPYLGSSSEPPGPQPPAPAPKPPRRARWHFRPARARQRAEQRLREYQARETWRDRRDAQQRAAKDEALRQQIARQRDALAERHLREQAALEERHARLKREAARREQLRQEREAREREEGRTRGLHRDRDPPLRPRSSSLSGIFRRAAARQSLSAIFRERARRSSLVRLFNRLAQMRRIVVPTRHRNVAQEPSRPAPPVPPRPSP